MSVFLLLGVPAVAFGQTADVLVNMTVTPNPVIAGANVTYHITASNNGPDASTNVVVTDSLPGSLTLVSATPSQGTCSGTTNITCSFGSIALYGNATVDIVAQTTSSGTVSDTASVSGAETDPDTTNNSVTKSITANVGADMSIGISGSPSTVTAGGSLTYTVTSANGGPSSASNVTITDPVPGGTTYQSYSGTGWTCTSASGTITCTRSGSTATGSLPNLTLVFKTTAAGTITNAISITATEGDSNSSNNTATTSNTVIAGADASVSESATASPVAVGNPLVYTFTFANNGPGTVTGLSFSDTLPANVTFGSISTSGWSCNASSPISCTYASAVASGVSIPSIVINTTASTAGSITNTGAITTTNADPTSSNNTASSSSTIQAPGADMALTGMSVSPNPITTGANVTYTISVKNNGPLTANGPITITDNVPAGLTFVSSSGTGWTCSAASSNPVTCTNSSNLNSGSSLANGSALALTFTATTSGSFSNLPCVSAASPTDPAPSNNCASSGTVTSTSTQADLVVTQDAPTPNPVLGNGVLTYNIHVTNNGPDDATSVTVSDSFANSTYVSYAYTQGSCTGLTPMTCSLGTLANGASATITAQIKPTATGTRSNTASASSSGVGDPNTANNSATVSSTVNPAADMMLTQTATPQPVLVGTNLTYVMTAKNNAGPSTASSVVVTENLPAGVTYVSATPSSGTCSQANLVVTCSLGNLNSNAQGTVTIVVTPTAIGSITANGSVTSSTADPDNTNNSASFTSTVNAAQVDVQVTKYGTPNPVAYGGTVTYTVTIHNSGPSIATGVVATDTPMTQFTLGTVTPSQGSCSGTTTVTCNIGTLASGANATITMVMTASSVGTFDNQVSVTSNESDTNTANNSADEQTTSRQGADLAVTKTVNPTSIPKNGTATYTMVVSNGGPVTSNTTTLTDTLPTGLTYVSSTASQGSCSGTTTVTCNLGSLANGANATVTITVSGSAVGSPTNSVTVSGSEPDPNSANNTATANLTVTPVADLTVAKTHSGNFTVGQTGAAYSIVVTNSGGAATTAAIAVTDTLPSGLTPTAASGTGWSCGVSGQTVTCSRADALAASTAYPAIAVTVNVAANAPSGLTNTATVAGGGEIVTTNDTASDPTTINQVADLTIAMASTGTFVINGSATYQLTATNSGLASTSGTVTVTDTLPAGLSVGTPTGTGWTCSVSGQAVTCTRSDVLALNSSYPVISVPVTFGASTASSITNNATVAGGGEINTANDTASETSSVAGLPDMTIGLTTTGTAVQGGTVTYVLTAGNGGGSASAGTVTVTDTFPSGLTPTSVGLTATGWICPTVTGQTVTCTRSDSLANASSYSPISIPVTISATAPASIPDAATVAGGGETNTSNDTATATLNVTQLPDMTIGIATSGTLAQGGSANILLTASNANATAASTATITVTTTLPAGLAPVPNSATGNGWSCSEAGQLVTCNTSDPIAGGANAGQITIPVTISTNAAASLAIAATVSGGGEVNTANDAANTTVNISGTPDLAITLSGSGTFAQGANGAQSGNPSYVIGSSNVGGAATSSAVTITDTFPAGITPVSASGSGWSCTPQPITGQTITCTRPDSLAAGAPYPNITVNVNVAPNAPASITDTATISGGGETNLSNDSASSTVTVGGVADMTVSLTPNGTFTQGTTGTLTVGVSNVGGMASSGAVTVVDTLPTGLTPTSATGAGWTCTPITGQTVTCTRPDSLSAGASYVQPITINVTTASNAPATVSDTVTVSGGSETNLANDTATQSISIGAAPDLTVAIAANGSFAQGANASYTITASNVGGAASNGTITVSDTFPAGVTPLPHGATGTGWTCVEAGQVVTCTEPGPIAISTASSPITVAVTVANTAPVSIADTVTIAGGGDTNPNNNTASVTTGVAASPDLTLTKTHTGSFTTASPGIYTLTASNIGGAPTSALVSVSDTLPTGLTPVSAAGTGWTCSIAASTVTCNRSDALAQGSSYAPISVTVSAAPTAVGTITNTATVSGGGEHNTSNNQAQDTASIAPLPDLAITKQHTGTLVRGGSATYTIAVSNTSATATDGSTVTVLDSLPAGLTPATAAGTGWTCTIAGQTATCTRHDVLAANSSYAPITITASIASIAPASLVNTAAVSGGGDATPGNNQGQDTGAVTGAVDLAITATQAPVFQKKASSWYALKVSNVGQSPTDGTAVTVVDTLPAGITPVSATGTNWACGIASQVATCTRTDVLAPGASYPVITLAVNVTSSASDTLVNNANVNGSGDTNLQNNSASQPVSIQPAAYSDLTVALSHSGDFTQGLTGQYSVAVSNIGTGISSGAATVTDTLPAGLSPLKASGDGWSCSIAGQTFTCTRSDALAAGSQYPALVFTVQVAPNAPVQITNFATVSGGGETNTANDQASDPTHILVPPMPKLGIAESADRSTVEMGDVLTYTLQITDSSNVAAENSVVTSQLPSSFVYVQGTARVQAGAASTQPLEPKVNGTNLVFQLGHIPPHGLVVITFRVRIGANVTSGAHANVSNVSGYAPTGQSVGPVSAQVSVNVGPNLLTAQRALVGRVYVDTNGNGMFDRGDSPAPGVRVFLSDGQAAITDSEGLYSLPTVPQGSVAVSIDPMALPAGYLLSDEGERQGQGFARLLRTPLGGGTVVRQNFALKRMPGAQPFTSGAASENNVASASGAASQKLTQPVPSNGSTQEHVEAATPVEPGALALLSPKPNDALTDPAPKIMVRVAQGWTAVFEVNGHRVDAAKISSAAEKEIRSTRLTLKEPDLAIGPNTLRITAISPEGKAGQTVEAAIHRSGPVKRLEVIADKRDVTAGGKETTAVTVRAYDAWGKPAADSSISLSTTRGAFLLGKARNGQAQVGKTGAQAARSASVPGFGSETAALDLHNIGAGAQSGFGNNFMPNSANLSTSASSASGSTLSGSAANSSSLSRALDEAGTSTSTSSTGVGAPSNSSGMNSWGLQAAGSALSAGSPNAAASEEEAKQQAVAIHNGVAVAQLRSSSETGSAEVVAATEGPVGSQLEQHTYVAFVPELRSPILVGVGELSFGHAAPEMSLFGESGSVERRTQFFYEGKLAASNLLTLGYSSQSPLNRTSGYDQMFQMDATNQQYIVFGDSSQRFYNAQSNSRLYARIDHGLSYLMFGDLSGGAQPQLSNSLTGFDRSITGVKLHLEDHKGSAVSVTGARPDTAYARDIFPGNSLGLIALSHQGVLPGSEVITLETRDRRNPGVILSRETLIRSTDYTMDNLSGSIFFLRSISALDSTLNLTQIVINYEYEAVGLSSSVYTARAEKRFDQMGMRLGLSVLNDRQGAGSSYLLAGIEGSKKLPNGGLLTFEAPVSRGDLAASGTAFTDTSTGSHNGTAVRAHLEEPISAMSGILRASLSKTDANFLNPFGSTIVPGAQTINGTYEFKPFAASHLRFGLTDERNKTVNVDNHRSTISAAWKQELTDRIDLTFGYDNRDYNNDLEHQVIDSNLLTLDADWRITDKLQASARREQNVGLADPTYPSQTVLSAKYQISPETRLFYTQRISSAPIIPIGDISGSGFAAVNSTGELAFGVETKLRPSTSLESRYEVDNGVNGTDSYAVLGVVDRLPLTSTTAVDFGAEHGLHIDGKGHDFNAGTAAISWKPTKFFRATSRYELRDQFGFASLVTAGAAGRISSGVTALGQMQFVRGVTNGQNTSLNRAIASLAIRPLKSERAGLLFSYNEQSGYGYNLATISSEPARVDILSTDAWWQALKRLEFYSRFAESNRTELATGQPDISTQTFMSQHRIQYRFARYFDAAGEARWLWQPVTNTDRRTTALELGGWLLPDIRLGLGYSFDSAPEFAPNFLTNPVRQGIYFNITGKFSRLFDLFGTAPEPTPPPSDARPNLKRW